MNSKVDLDQIVSVMIHGLQASIVHYLRPEVSKVTVRYLIKHRLRFSVAHMQF